MTDTIYLTRGEGDLSAARKVLAAAGVIVSTDTEPSEEMTDHWRGPDYVDGFNAGRSVALAEAKAEALEEAAENFGFNQITTEGDVREWLRARAAAIRAEASTEGQTERKYDWDSTNYAHWNRVKNAGLHEMVELDVHIATVPMCPTCDEPWPCKASGQRVDAAAIRAEAKR